MTACASCHATRTTKQLNDQVRAWWGESKPPGASGGGATGGGATGGGATGGARRVFGDLARALEKVPAPDGPPLSGDERSRLSVLTQDPDVDIRALALAMLHLTAGEEPAVRRQLAQAAAREGSHDFALRSRWAVALGFMGDRYAESGDFAAARVAYGRGLDVTPDNARLLQSRGNAERGAGDHPAAVASYERALLLDRSNALIMVNLGIALGAAGDSARGEEMFRGATQADPGEPLGWFNLGNVTLLKGDFAGATRDFERAVAIDGALTQAHFQLARIHLLQRNSRAALKSLRRGLAIDSSDAAARAMARQLEKASQP